MKKLCLVLCVCLPAYLVAQVSIIPQPAEVTMPKIAGKFAITQNTPIVLDGSGLENSANFLNDYLQQVYGFKLKVQNKPSELPAIHLNFERLDHPIPGAYTLEVKQLGVFISGDNETGAFYGVQSLLQLLPVEKSSRLSIPFVSINDYPRFGYRGMHLDVGRHFFPVEFVKRYIDYIALHKMNYFHWHLTEDQGWRIEIKKYPKLTSVGAWRPSTIIGHNPGIGNDSIRHGGFYTQEQVKEVVAYAAKRYITIIPEIEMPGHSSAALEAYPYLGCTGGPYKVQQKWGVFKDVYCAGNDSVFAFMQDVLNEVIPLFPAKYVHIGADECPKDSWKVCPKCQKRIKDLKLKDEHELQSYFVQRMEKYINSKGKTMIGWDEILEGGLAPNAVVMSWRGEQGGIDAAKQNHDVIMTPTTYVYLDYAQSKREDSLVIGGYLPLDKVYNYEPLPQELTPEQQKHILGAQANVWTEYMKTPRKVEYMIFPRMSALSEVLWSPKEKKNYTDFQKRLQTQFKRYDLWNANYSKAFFDLSAKVLQAEKQDGILWKLESITTDSVAKIMVDIDNPHSQFQYSTPFRISSSSSLKADLFQYDNEAGAWNPKVLNSLSQQFFINKATGKKVTLINPPSKNYPGDGPFTLVNGVINSTGLTNANEFLGFSGTDLEAVIDLGKPDSFSAVNVHVLDLPDSWIHAPAKVEAYVSGNDTEYYPLENNFTPKKDGFEILLCNNLKQKAFGRYVKVVAKNIGPIPSGLPGAGSSAWLFIDEIQVN
jgi:hexosaminidase